MNSMNTSEKGTGHDWGEPDERGVMGCLNSDACPGRVRYVGRQFQYRDERGDWQNWTRGAMARCRYVHLRRERAPNTLT